MKRPQQEFNQVLDSCLDQLLREGDSVESCLQRYPQHASELEPLLRTALVTRAVLDVTPVAKARARQALQAAMSRREAHSQRRNLLGFLGGLSAQLTGSRRWAAAATAATLLLALSGTGIVAASSESVPGQPLYPVKRAVEEARLVTTFDNQSKARLNASFASHRSQEMSVVASKGDLKGAERLAKEADKHLQQVQLQAFPGLSISVTDVTPRPKANGPPEQLVQEMKQLKPNAADKRNLKALQEHLKSELEHQDKVFQQQMKKAPEPARKGLETAQKATRQEYEAMLRAAKWLAEKDD